MPAYKFEALDASGKSKLARPRDRRPRTHIQLTLFEAGEHPLLDQIRALDLNELTPLEALTRIKSWQDELAKKKGKR